MKPNQLSHFIPLPLFLALSACGSSNTAALDESFDVVLLASSDEGQPVEGARFTHGDSTVGTTDATGKIAAQIRGVDGQTMAVTTTCPDGYQAPEQPAELRLTEVRKLDPTASAAIHLKVVCVRKMRDIVLVVRTNQAPVLPVEVDGKPLFDTDTNGQAHYHFRLDRSVSRMSVSLATSAAPKLRPQNPSRVFELDGQDAVLLFDQSFTEERRGLPKRRVVVAKKVEEPVRRIPYRIDSGRSHAF